MNVENYEYLTEKALPKLGIYEAFNKALENELKAGQPSFMLKATTDFEANKMEYEFLFKKSENPNDDRYFLNKVDATIIRPEGDTEKQTFNLYNQTGLNLEQMHGLMEARFAYREYTVKNNDNTYTKEGAWFYIDRNRPDENGEFRVKRIKDNDSSFNLVAELSKVPLGYMKQEEKTRMMHDLQQGRRVFPFVNMPDGKREKGEIVVNPQKGILLYNKEGQEVKYKKDNGKVVAIDVTQSAKVTAEPKLNGTTVKLLEKGQAAAEGKDLKPGGRKKVG